MKLQIWLLVCRHLGFSPLWCSSKTAGQLTFDPAWTYWRIQLRLGVSLQGKQKSSSEFITCRGFFWSSAALSCLLNSPPCVSGPVRRPERFVFIKSGSLLCANSMLSGSRPWRMRRVQHAQHVAAVEQPYHARLYSHHVCFQVQIPSLVGVLASSKVYRRV